MVSVEQEIAAPPETVYDLVANLPRMGEWSPECARVQWRGGNVGATDGLPRVGATFSGHNRNGWRRWSTHGRVVRADRGREFAFDVRSVFNLPVARWSYRLETTAGGCRVTESTEDRRGAVMRVLGPLATGVRDRAARNRETMHETLRRLRAAAEGPGGVAPHPPDTVVGDE